VDPQANFLQAALDRKKAGSKGESIKWGVLGGLLAGRGTGDETGGDLQERLQELEAENASQAEVIKDLRKDMMTMQTGYKEKAYTAQQQMQEVMKERDEVLLKNKNLMKELELARKLQSFASRDPDEN
jgi:succinate dehydrogenase/fumarate reductase flavoprotein subunit